MKAKMLNASSDIIEQLYFKKDWRNILRIRNNIRIPTSNPLRLDNYVHDQPDSVWEIIDRDGIIVHDNDSYLSKIQSDPQSVLENPADIYFVDRGTKAKYLTDNHGVFITSRRTASASPLKATWKHVLKSGDMFSWDMFFKQDVMNKIIPSNSLIIVDRYLFSRFDAGVQNLLDILDSVLPQTMHGAYHVLVVTDEEQVLNDKTHHNIDSAVSGIQDVIPAMERPYEIVMEVLLVKPVGKQHPGRRRTPQEKAAIAFYADTHDRHIISNYFIVSAEHGLCAVREDESGKLKATFKQTLTFEGIYSGIDNKYQDLTSLPSKSCDDFIQSVNRFTHSEFPMCLYYINARKGDASQIMNRLLV